MVFWLNLDICWCWKEETELNFYFGWMSRHRHLSQGKDGMESNWLVWSLGCLVWALFLKSIKCLNILGAILMQNSWYFFGKYLASCVLPLLMQRAAVNLKTVPSKWDWELFLNYFSGTCCIPSPGCGEPVSIQSSSSSGACWEYALSLSSAGMFEWCQEFHGLC